MLEYTLDPDHSVDYDSQEAVYPRFRYNPPRDFLERRNENEYQDELTLQPDNFAHSREYRPLNREFATSRSWPDIFYKHNRPWNTYEHSFPPSSNRWPWAQQSDFRYWPERGKYPQDRNYWTPLESEEDMMMSHTENEEWPQQQQQQQRIPFWQSNISNTRPIGKPLKVQPPWRQVDGAIKTYGRDQLINWGEKSKNHSELNKKEDIDNKVVLPKITMKTWNSLTSDPATWPYKLPNAKPWPKDENGKSYNPNADLIRKLGLDKEGDADWPQGKKEKIGKLVFQKQTGTVTSKNSSKKEEFMRLNDTKYKMLNNNSNYSDYKKQESMKETPNWMYQNVKNSKNWIKTQTPSNTPKIHGTDSWNKKPEEPPGTPWSRKTQPIILSKIQSTGSDGPIKNSNSNQENSSFSHLSPPNTINSNEQQQWSNKYREPLMESWRDNTRNSDSWSVKVNGGNSWKGKAENTWLSKTKENSWATKSAPTSWRSKVGDSNSWQSRTENDASWRFKPSNAGSWTTNNNIWPEKSNNINSWSSASNDLHPWFMKEKAEQSWTKSNTDSWPQKVKDNNSWTNKLNSVSTWRSNDDDWPRKSGQNSWQQKINDDWNMSYRKSSASTWPSKWKQFAYHKVMALPISKPGTAADVASPKSRNAFVAVSAVSSANGNVWRRNDVEDTIHEGNFRLEEPNRSSNQIRPESERPIYAWKKDGSSVNNNSVRRSSNGTDPLENQLEALRRDDSWPYKENEVETIEVMSLQFICVTFEHIRLTS